MKNKLDKNLDFFDKRLPELLEDSAYKGKFVVIFNEKIEGTYDSFEAALTFAVSRLPGDEFIIQQVVAEGERINFIRAAVA